MPVTSEKSELNTAEPLIEARGLSVTLGGVQVLTGIDISLQSAEIVTLVGLNGSGKSTLVKYILTNLHEFLKPTKLLLGE